MKWLIVMMMIMISLTDKDNMVIFCQQHKSSRIIMITMTIVVINSGNFLPVRTFLALTVSYHAENAHKP